MTKPLSPNVWTRNRHPDEAHRSWWLDPGTRDEFAAAAERERGRILRSRAATMTLGSNIIVGWTSSGRKP